MKKVLAMLLAMVMAGSLVVGCSNTETPADEPVVDEPVVSEVEVTPEEVPEAKYHFSFDDATGLTPVTQVTKATDSVNTGATYDIAEVEAEVLFSNGPVGQCVYANGQYGYKLDMEAINTDAYTVSFWMNADRLSTYGPTLQMGRHMGYADTGSEAVTWMNFTKTEWGTASADIFPVVWNRNSETGVWPWVYATDDSVHGKREWVMVTVVTSGERYVCPDDGLERIGTKMYLNGEMVWDASAELGLYGGLSPEILTGEGFEAYLGVNYWDTIFKGYFDEVYLFDCALTDGQVLSLFQEGDINVESVQPEYEDLVLEETSGSDAAPVVITPVTDIAVDASAVETVGSTDFTTGWWTDWSQGYELADGASVTVKLNNYSDGAANWDNYVIAFTNTLTDGVTAPSADNFAGYAEYAIVRADAYGWGDASYAAAFENSWTDWNTWLAAMTDAEVTIVITRNGGEIVMDTTITAADGSVLTQKATVTSTLTADAPCYFFITGEKCYIEVLSVA